MYIEDFESFANGIRSRQYSNRFLSGIKLRLIGSTPFVEAFLALFRRLNKRTILHVFLIFSVRIQVVGKYGFNELQHLDCSSGIPEEQVPEYRTQHGALIHHVLQKKAV